MKISIEQIAGKPCTVIRKPFDADFVRGQLEMGVPVVAGGASYRCTITSYEESNFFLVMHGRRDDGALFAYADSAFKHVLTILPALPRYPKAEDAPLLYRYMAEGIEPVLTNGVDRWIFGKESLDAYGQGKIIHGLMGNHPAEIAIEGVA